MNYFASLLLLFMAVSCVDNQKEIASNSAEEFPSNYMFMQRAYPTGAIKTDAYKTAIQWKKQQQRSAGGSWEFVGPTNIGGRITDIEIPFDQPSTYFVGAASGGIFKTTDAGASWNSIFDEQQMLSIGDIEISKNNSAIVWVGTGEPNAGGGSLAYDGDGIYKSEDGGTTWEVKGLPDVGSIGKVLIDPNDNNTVFVGAMGPLFKNDNNRGVYKTSDGGATWEQKLFVSDSTGVIDMAMHPSNGNIVYAASWERVRRPERNHYFGETSRIYRTTDGGENWTELTNGLPTTSTNKGRISIDISQSNPNVLYAHFTDPNGITGIYKTVDGGDTWATLNAGNVNGASYEWWFGGLFIDPTDENKVFYTGFTNYKTTDGGATWNDTFNNVHVDQHVIAFSPINSEEVLLGNDGGLYTSNNGGSSWTKEETLPITQLYRCYVDPNNEDKIYAGAQDNGTNRTQTGSENDWQSIYGGDGFQPLVDHEDTNTIFAMYQYGNIGKSIDNGINWNGVNAPGSRKNWNTPVSFDPNDSQIMYYGANQLYKSINGGINWNAISPDLTNGPGGGNLTYGSLTTVDASAFNADKIVTGSDDGNVYLTVDGGANWTKISESLPNRWVTKVLTSVTQPGTIYATFSGYRWGTNEGHVYVTYDNGVTWNDLSTTIPDVPVNDIVEDASGKLYIATDVGVLASGNGGALWEPLDSNMPAVVVTDLHIHEASQFLYAATYGRSMYKFDLSQVILGNELPMQEDAFVMFPNPADGQVNIQMESGTIETIEVFDVNGRLQFSETFEVPSAKINLNQLASGVYFVKVTSGKFRSTKKLLVR